MWRWDDVRFFLSAVREGSLSGAARALGADHATVGRRMASLERQLGATLVNRTPDGFLLTAAGQALLAECQNIEAAAVALERLAAGYDRRVSGLVRLTTTAALPRLIIPALAALREEHPQLEVEMIIDHRFLDISRRQADIAVRVGKPTDPQLVGRKIGEYGATLYGSRSYIERHGAPKRGQGLGGHSLVGFMNPFHLVPSAIGAPFIGESVEGAQFAFRCNSILEQARAIANGLGLGELPCYLGDEDPGLERVWPDEPPRMVPIWLLTHEDLRRSARIRLVSNAIADAFRQQTARLRY